MHKLSTIAAGSTSLSSLEPLAVDISTTGNARIILGNEEKGQGTVHLAVTAVQALRSAFPRAQVNLLHHAGRLVIELKKRDEQLFTAYELAAIKKFAKPVYEVYGSVSVELINDPCRTPNSQAYHIATLLTVKLSAPFALKQGRLAEIGGIDKVWLARDPRGRVTHIEVSLIRPVTDCVPETLNKLAVSCGIFIEELPAKPPCVACDQGHTLPV